MTYTNDTNPGAPFGARWDDNYHSGPAPRTERYTVNQPWSGEEQCRNCKLSGGCREHNLLVPKVRIPGAPGPDVRLPCTDEWDLFDTEEPSDLALSLCAGCPFREWCELTATVNNEHFTWGGTTRADRKNNQMEVAA